MAELSQEAVVKVKVNGEEARKELEKLETVAKDLRTRIAEAYAAGDDKKAKKLEAQLRGVNSELRTMRKNTQNINDVMGRLSTASPKELRKTLQDINKELNSGKIKRGSQEWTEYNQKAKQVAAELRKINAEQREQASLMSRVTDGFNKYAAIATGMVATLTGITFTARKAVDAFAEMDEAQAQVIKYTGLSREEVKKLNEEFDKLDTRTSKIRLNEMAGDAGRLGITELDKIMEFVDAADKINVALGEDLGEDAVKNMGKLAMMFGEDKALGLRGAMLATASAVNEVAQNSNAAEPYLVDFIAQVAGASNQAGIAQANLIGFASVLDQNMLRSEKAATAFQKVLMKMYQEPADLAKLAGIDVKQFTEVLEKDANEALLLFFDTLSKKGGLADLAPIFKELKLQGEGAASVLSVLSGKVGDIRVAQKLANDAYREGNSAINEFNVQNSTIQAKIDKRRNALNSIAVELGEKLYPLMKYGLSLGTLSLKTLKELVVFFTKYGVAVSYLVGIIGIYIAAEKLAVLWTTKLKDAHLLTLATTKLRAFWDKAAAAATWLYIAATSALAGKTVTARLAMEAFFKTLRLNPFSAILTTIFAVAGGIYLLARRTNALTASVQAAQDIQREANKSTAEEINKIETLRKVLNDNNSSYRQKKEALNKLKEIVPDYHGALDKEGKLINNNASALDKYVEKLKLTAMVQQANSKLSEAQGAFDDWVASQGTDAYRYLNVMQSAGSFENQGKSAEEVAAKEGVSPTAFRAWESKRKQLLDNVKIYDNLLKEYTKQMFAVEEKYKPTEEDEDDEKKKTKKKKVPLTDEEMKEIIKSIDDKLQIERTKQLAAYVTGEQDKKKYDDAINALDIEALTKKRDLYAKNTGEYAKYQEDILKKQQELSSKQSADDRETIKQSWEGRKQDLLRQYANERIDLKAYKQGLVEAEIEYLTKIKNSHAEGTKERVDAEKALEDKLLDDKKEKREEYEKTRLKFREEYSKKTVQELHAKELADLDVLHKAGLIKEEEYQKMKQAIAVKYAGMETYVPGAVEKGDKTIKDAVSVAQAKGKSSLTEEDSNRIANGDLLFTAFGAEAKMRQASMDALKQMEDEGLLSHQQYLQAKAEMDGEYFSGLAETIQAAYAIVDSVVSAYSSYVQAGMDAEVAAIEDRYDKEIEAAGNSKRAVRQLESEKEKEIAKVKAQYQDKAFKIQIAQALAQTAISALNAYSSAAAVPLVGYILAPIAAAAAVAAGMMNVATIKKQHDAAKQGYATGGYTPRGRWNEEQGVVHSNEFVANRFATNNPEIRPVLDLIDRAQKNNTIGRLTASDVSRVLGTGGADGATTSGASGTTVVAQVDNSATIAVLAETAEALALLKQKLDAGIESFVVMDGPGGLSAQQKHYERLNNNKNRS